MDDSKKRIQDVYSQHAEHYQSQMLSGNLTFATDYTDQMAKIILLSVASYFETSITEVMKINLNISCCPLTANFLDKKALSRQYHTLFQWEQSNANAFFSLFGDDFKAFMSSKVKEQSELDNAIKDFLLLGSLRNQLVHKNFVTFSLQITAADIMSKFESAHTNFVALLPVFINEFRQL